MPQMFLGIGIGLGTPAPTYTYRWTRDGVDIAGATAATHVIVVEDQLTNLACIVTATNAGGSASVSTVGLPIP